MFDPVKEKSWSVKLIKGYILNNQVRNNYCGTCKSTSRPVAGNYNDPNIVLFGCNDRKCKHILMRMKIGSEADELDVRGRADEIVLENAPISS